MSFALLNDDVVFEILKNVNSGRSIIEMRGVCRRFRQIIDHKPILEIYPTTIVDNELKKFHLDKTFNILNIYEKITLKVNLNNVLLVIEDRIKQRTSSLVINQFLKSDDLSYWESYPNLEHVSVVGLTSIFINKDLNIKSIALNADRIDFNCKQTHIEKMIINAEILNFNIFTNIKNISLNMEIPAKLLNTLPRLEFLQILLLKEKSDKDVISYNADHFISLVQDIDIKKCDTVKILQIHNSSISKFINLYVLEKLLIKGDFPEEHKITFENIPFLRELDLSLSFLFDRDNSIINNIIINNVPKLTKVKIEILFINKNKVIVDEIPESVSSLSLRNVKVNKILSYDLRMLKLSDFSLDASDMEIFNVRRIDKLILLNASLKNITHVKLNMIGILGTSKLYISKDIYLQDLRKFDWYFIRTIHDNNIELELKYKFDGLYVKIANLKFYLNQYAHHGEIKFPVQYN